MSPQKNKKTTMANEQQKPDETQITDTTTYDLSPEAQEALARLEAERRAESAADPKSSVFGPDMKLKVSVGSTPHPMVIQVQGEVTIGRRDPVTNYVPELDLTSHAAYRLGVSRRHALIRQMGDELRLVDLGSRNGTFLNGKKVEANNPQKLRDGDLIRVGKIVLRVAFLKDEA
jgi:hypothetical protein